MNKVYIVGIGPGSKDYLLPAAKKEIKRSDVLVGGKRALALFRYLNKEEVYLEGHFDQAIRYIEENRDRKRIAVLVSGDPGLHSFLGQILRLLKKEEYIVIPGISAIQVAFAKIGEAWQDAKIISLHGRRVDNLVAEVKAYRRTALFTDPNFPPSQIASCLLENNIENRRAVVCENLTYPDERIINTDLETLSQMKGFGLCVMIIGEALD
jgi:cobalt-precorrin-7 (C5)-methyltransferase